MSRYDDWDDEAFDLALDERDEERQAMLDGAEEEFDDKYAATYECSVQNPECAWVTEHDDSGLPYYWCETHE